jgi:hypothetical protein
MALWPVASTGTPTTVNGSAAKAFAPKLKPATINNRTTQNFKRVFIKERYPALTEFKSHVLHSLMPPLQGRRPLFYPFIMSFLLGMD